jgi:hypothetical protein
MAKRRAVRANWLRAMVSKMLPPNAGLTCRAASKSKARYPIANSCARFG